MRYNTFIIMPAKDIYHETLKTSLIKDGWTITHDPLRIRLARGKNFFVDLGAKRLLEPCRRLPSEESPRYFAARLLHTLLPYNFLSLIHHTRLFLSSKE